MNACQTWICRSNFVGLSRRFRETKNEVDKYAFRTPSLINVEVTGPYGHNGAYDSLRDMVVHHLNPTKAVSKYDSSKVSQTGMQMENTAVNSQLALKRLQDLQLLGKSKLANIELSDTQIDQLVEFLKTLSDPRVLNSSELSDWVPSQDEVDPDGLRLVPKLGQ